MFEKLKAMLTANHARFREIHHPSEGNSERVATVRGTEVGQGAKAMLCSAKEDENILILAILPGDKKLDFKKLAQAVPCKKITLAAPEVATEKTGCVIGAIPPFSFSPHIRLIVDPGLLARYEEIAFNAGRLDTSIVLNAEDYVRISRPSLHDICVTE
ncbi:YbaK/prolyl-tRNA synthetase associated domain-containing protein [Undibacterium sp. Ji67W]|uniref:YbaK/prolyl-tRNA synthetase associated domain-containing protein n=1 Tax=Undibacterium sp. Ji67W TaxID=3413042 RepID=UPI003BF03ED0